MSLNDLNIGSFIPEKDYNNYKKFWSDRGRVWPKRDMLSDLGLVISENDKMIAACFIYITNSKMAQIGFPASSPDVGPKTRLEAMYLLIKYAKETIREQGYRYAATFSSLDSLSKMFVKNGFTKLQEHDFLLRDLGGNNGT